MTSKVDSCGRYLPYQGISFVCMIDDSELPIWSKLYDFLSKQQKLTEYYSPLPVSSYHFTVKNHKTAHDPSEFISYTLLNAKKISRMGQVCKTYNYGHKVKMLDTYIRGSIGIYIKPDEEESLEMLRDELVSLGSFPEDDFVYHVTLGYQYKKIPKEEKKIVREQFQLLHDYIEFLFRPVDYNFKVKPCDMVYFSDMTIFTSINYYHSSNLCRIRYTQEGITHTLAIFDSYVDPGDMLVEDIDNPFDYVKNNIKDFQDLVVVRRSRIKIQPTKIWIERYITG